MACKECGCRDCDRGASKCPNCGELVELLILEEEWRRVRHLYNFQPKAAQKQDGFYFCYNF